MSPKKNPLGKVGKVSEAMPQKRLASSTYADDQQRMQKRIEEENKRWEEAKKRWSGKAQA
jgi:hypothetical protein